MADLLTELQRMAETATHTCTADTDRAEIQHWQNLFGFSYSQAEEKIRQFRNDLGRDTVSDEHWHVVRCEKEARGYDRESYEYECSLTRRGRRGTLEGCGRKVVDGKAMYVMKLEVPLETMSKVREVTGREVKMTTGTGDLGSAEFCVLDAHMRQKILDWIAMFQPCFSPTIVRLCASSKDLRGFSLAPFLGMDTSLPQDRADDAEFIPLPLQDQYPVWYFFYGKMASSEDLQSCLGLAEPPRYVAARVYGARIKSWRGKYRALVDAGVECVVEGSACLVRSRDEEDVLRFYETEKYGVVRCRIEMKGGVEPGLVFRFAGAEHELA